MPVPEEQLPVRLPEDVTQWTVVHRLFKADPEWRKTEYQGQPAEHETDTFDTFMESSWYYARYCSAQTDDAMLDPEKANYWLPVDQYIGGIGGHAILPVVCAFLPQIASMQVSLTPMSRLSVCYAKGMVLADSFCREDDKGGKQWISPLDVDLDKDDKGAVVSARHKADGQPVEIAGMSKMSKSKITGSTHKPWSSVTAPIRFVYL